jgi:uncharacterized protein (DUF2132 family)
MLGRQHRLRPAQADSSPRPLRRRACKMARPARVRIRRRKPWVLARRRLFGWKVRLLTVWLHRNKASGARLAGALGSVGQRPARIRSEHWCIGTGSGRRVTGGTREFNGTDPPLPRSNRSLAGARTGAVRFRCRKASGMSRAIRKLCRRTRHARSHVEVAVRHCELTGCAVRLSARTLTLRDLSEHFDHQVEVVSAPLHNLWIILWTDLRVPGCLRRASSSGRARAAVCGARAQDRGS